MSPTSKSSKNRPRQSLGAALLILHPFVCERGRRRARSNLRGALLHWVLHTRSVRGGFDAEIHTDDDARAAGRRLSRLAYTQAAGSVPGMDQSQPQVEVEFCGAPGAGGDECPSRTVHVVDRRTDQVTDGVDARPMS